MVLIGCLVVVLTINYHVLIEAKLNIDPIPDHREYSARTQDASTRDAHTQDWDIIIGGVFPIRTRAENNTCGELNIEGLQEKYAMVQAVEAINNNNALLQGIKIGTMIFDSCDSISMATHQAMKFIQYIAKRNNCHCDQDQRLGELVGVVGGASSSVSAQMASLFRIDHLTQVSYWATSSELDNRVRYGYHFRTVPSDASLTNAIIQFVNEFEWNYLSAVYEDSSFGRKAVEELQKQAKLHTVCLADVTKFSYDMKIATEDEFRRIADKIANAPKAKVVIVFAQIRETNMLFEAVKRRGQPLNERLVWILSHNQADDEYPPEIEGAFLFSHWTQTNKEFQRKFVSDFLHKSHDVPVYKLSTSATMKYGSNYTHNAEDDLSHSLFMSRKVPFVIDSVYSFAYAIEKMMKANNTASYYLPTLLKDRKAFSENMEEISFQGASGNKVEFNDRGSIRSAKYKVRQLRFNGSYNMWSDVAVYENNTLTLLKEGLFFKRSNPRFPNSVCADACAVDEEVIPDDENSRCCWVCRVCGDLQILTDTRRCQTCPDNQRPNTNRTNCYDIPIETVALFNKWGVGVFIVSVIGMVAVIVTAAILARYRDTPIVKASGKELSYLLLWGIFLAYLNGFIGSNKPTAEICTLIRLGIGSSYTLCFAALLIKTNRISRIFNRSRRGAMKTTHCISPSSQIALCLLLFTIQLIIIVAWLIMEPPKTVYSRPTIVRMQLVCRVLTNSSFMIVLIYPAFLLLVCVFYAFKTRKCPAGFNETKFIGFTAYVTCIIWLSFIPVYFITSNMPLRQTALNVALTLTATVAFIFLFAPKIYMILFKPEKNTKKSIMGSSNENKPRTFKDIVKSVQAQQMGDKASDLMTSGKKKPSLAMVVMAAKQLDLQRAAAAAAAATTETDVTTITTNGGAEVVAEVHREDDSGIGDNTTTDQHILGMC